MTRGPKLRSPSLGAHLEVLLSLALRQKEETKKAMKAKKAKKAVSFEPMEKAAQSCHFFIMKRNEKNC